MFRSFFAVRGRWCPSGDGAFDHDRGVDPRYRGSLLPEGGLEERSGKRETHAVFENEISNSPFRSERHVGRKRVLPSCHAIHFYVCCIEVR